MKINTCSFQISWLKNGRPLSPGSQRIQANYKGSLAMLKISNVAPEDSGEYTVFADNSYGKVRFLKSGLKK